MNLDDTLHPRRAVQRRVAGNRAAIGHDRHCLDRGGIAIAIDHDPRIGLVQERRVQPLGQHRAKTEYAYIPGDMSATVGGR